MRNLSYQLYAELPPSVRLRLEGPTRDSAPRDSEAIGCFALHNKKNAEVNVITRKTLCVKLHPHRFTASLYPQQRYHYLSILSEVSRQPNGSEWLWHPKVVVLYKLVLQNSDVSSTSREAAIGALQNITAGEARVGREQADVCLTETRAHLLPLCPVVVSAEQRDDGAGEDAAHPAGSVGHQQRHGAEAADRPAEEPGQTLHQQRAHR